MKRTAIIFILILLLLAGCAPVKQSAPVSGTLEAHFIDVGQGDCILLRCDGEAMLIDAGVSAAGEGVADYLAEAGVAELKYAVGTHAHEDHIGGLSAVMDSLTVDALIMPDDFTDSMAYQRVLEAAERQSVSQTVPVAGDKYSLGGAEFTILAPLEQYSDKNNSSIVLRLTYGETAFVFTGDMEYESAKDIVDSGAELRADVLKVGHHGSDNSTPYSFLREVMPSWAVIQVGADNDYGHPHEELMSRLEQSGASILRTDLNGTVVITSDGETLTVQTERGAAEQPGQPAELTYIGNKNSKKFHTPDCSGLPAEQNRVYFSTRDEAVAAGYEPCGNCNP